MTSTTSLPAVLCPALSDREAVADALYRLLIAFDTDDSALFDSSLTDNATMTINGRTLEGVAAIRTDCYDVVKKLDTTHLVTNPRINIEGDKAKLTATVLSQHYREGKGLELGQPMLLAGSLYWADMVRDGELWKIESVSMKSNWFEGDRSVVTGE